MNTCTINRGNDFIQLFTPHSSMFLAVPGLLEVLKYKECVLLHVGVYVLSLNCELKIGWIFALIA